MKADVEAGGCGARAAASRPPPPPQRAPPPPPPRRLVTREQPRPGRSWRGQRRGGGRRAHQGDSVGVAAVAAVAGGCAWGVGCRASAAAGGKGACGGVQRAEAALPCRPQRGVLPVLSLPGGSVTKTWTQSRVYACMHVTHTSKHTHTRTHAHTQTHTHAYTHARMHTRTHQRVRARAHTHTPEDLAKTAWRSGAAVVLEAVYL